LGNAGVDGRTVSNTLFEVLTELCLLGYKAMYSGAGVDVEIGCKRNTCIGRLWIGFFWLRVRSSGGLL
jgi:hypothetical protein